MRNLLGRLLERSTPDLERIARTWAIELRGADRHTDVSFIYRTMTDIWAMRDVWERVPAAGKALVRALEARDGATCTLTELAAETGQAPDDARQELQGLYDAGIVATETFRAHEGATPETRYFLPREMGMMVERVETEHAAASPRDLALDDLLASVLYPELEEAATAWGARVIPAMHARGELVSLVREQLARPERVERLIAASSAAARNAWARLVKADGVLPLDELLPPGDVPLLARRRIVRELAGPLLLWHGYDGDTRLAIVPRAILHPEPPAVELPPELRLVDAAGIATPSWTFPYAAAWDLLTLLREVTQSAPRWRPLAEGDPALERRLRRRLWQTDPESLDLPVGYIPFLTRVAAGMGVLREDDERAVPGDMAQQWREHSFTTAQQRMVAAWTEIEDWVEGQERVDANLHGASWPRLRATLIQALGELEEERWYDEDRFVERLLKTKPELLRQATLTAVGAPRRAQLDTAADAAERRLRVLTLVVGTTLETACVWLGLIARSYQLETERPVLQVTPFGRWIAGKRVEPQLTTTGDTPLSVGAGFQVQLYRPTPRRVWALSAFAEPQTLARVATWNLTAEALIRALAGGVDLSQIIAFLERQNGGPLPRNVALTLAEWDRGYRRVWLRRAVLLVPEEGEDPAPVAAALKEAGLDPELLPDGRIALVFDDPDAGERLYTAAHRALRERGFAPLREPAAGTAGVERGDRRPGQR